MIQKSMALFDEDKKSDCKETRDKYTSIFSTHLTVHSEPKTS